MHAHTYARTHACGHTSTHAYISFCIALRVHARARWRKLTCSVNAGMASDQGRMDRRGALTPRWGAKILAEFHKKRGCSPAPRAPLKAAGTATLTWHNLFQQNAEHAQMRTCCACLFFQISAPRCMPFAQCHSGKIPFGVPACNPLGVKKAKIPSVGLGVL